MTSYLQRFEATPEAQRWPLVRGWMLDCLKGCGPYTVLLVGGEQGSAKSTLCKAVRQAVDPVHKAPARRLQRDEYELAIAAQKNALLVFDNVSSLPQTITPIHMLREITAAALPARGALIVPSAFTRPHDVT